MELHRLLTDCFPPTPRRHHAFMLEGGVAFAACAAGHVANIMQPAFGRMDNGLACNASTSYATVLQACLGRPSCAVPASADLFGDPVRA